MYSDAQSIKLARCCFVEPISLSTSLSRTPTGVIGDIDDVILRNECAKQKLKVVGTSCYGAPFEHCDIRRDQVALVLCIATVLSGINWSLHCDNTLKSEGITEKSKTLQGYGSQRPGAKQADLSHKIARVFTAIQFKAPSEGLVHERKVKHSGCPAT